MATTTWCSIADINGYTKRPWRNRAFLHLTRIIRFIPTLLCMSPDFRHPTNDTLAWPSVLTGYYRMFLPGHQSHMISLRERVSTLHVSRACREHPSETALLTASLQRPKKVSRMLASTTIPSHNSRRRRNGGCSPDSETHKNPAHTAKACPDSSQVEREHRAAGRALN